MERIEYFESPCIYRNVLESVSILRKTHIISLIAHKSTKPYKFWSKCRYIILHGVNIQSQVSCNQYSD